MQHLWKTRIQDYFKNKRKRSERNNPEVQKRIAEHAAKKQKLENGTAAPSPVVKNVYGIPNFNPPRVPGEDDTSIKAAKEFLIAQDRLPVLRRDQPKIDIRMDKTYPERRQEILDGASVSSLKVQYPDLLSEEGVGFFLSYIVLNNGLASYPHWQDLYVDVSAIQYGIPKTFYF